MPCRAREISVDRLKPSAADSCRMRKRDQTKMNTGQIKSVTVYTEAQEKRFGTECLREDTVGDVRVVSVDLAISQSEIVPERGISLSLNLPFEIDGWMADFLYSRWWCRPEFGVSLSDIPDQTQALLWHCKGGTWGAILPLCEKTYSTSLYVRDGNLCAELSSFCKGLQTCQTPVLVWGQGTDPYRLLQQCAAAASDILGIPLRQERHYPELFNYLGWCSWDAMEIWVDEAGLLEKCREFRERGVPVRWAILDDMWADIAWTEKLPKFTPHKISVPVMHASKMNDFTADPERFPSGLDGCIRKMKEMDFSVGIWHPTTGYWSGLTPEGAAHQKLRPFVREMESGLVLPDLTDREKSYGFYNTLHRYFRDCGADFVKVDNQSFLRTMYRDVAPIGELAENLHDGIERSVTENFGGAVINCMGMANENLFHRSESAVSRCSNDFAPENRAWFSKHLLQCAYNGLIQGQFYVCDWDMWWTDDGQAVKNSVCRAVSGGPIYVSDRQGRTNPEILKPLCYSDGRILRCDAVAVPGIRNLCSGPACSDDAFFLLNRVKDVQMIAAFNINEKDKTVTGRIIPREYGYADDCILYEHFSKQAIRLQPKACYSFSLLDNDAVRLFMLIPVKGEKTPIGLVDKYISPAAILSQTPKTVQLYEPGLFAWYEDGIHFINTESATVEWNLLQR